MRRKIFATKEQITFRLKIFWTPRSPRFLNITIQIFRTIVKLCSEIIFSIIDNFKTDSSEYIKKLVDKLALMDDDDVKKNATQIVNEIQGALANTILLYCLS